MAEFVKSNALCLAGGGAAAALAYCAWRCHSWYYKGFPYGHKGDFSVTPYLTGSSNVMIVGGTDGIGLQMAIQCLSKIKGAHNKGKLCVVGRANIEDLLERHKKDSEALALFQDAQKDNLVSYSRVDVSSPNCGQKIVETLGDFDVDILIFAAADGWVGPLPAETLDRVEKTVHATFTGFAITAKHVIRKMLQKTSASNTNEAKPRKERKVVVLGSIVSTIGTPFFATYTAGKAALDAFVWSLKTELEETNIAVQVVHPGATATNFFAKVGVKFDTSKFADKSVVAKQILHAVRWSQDMSVNLGSFSERAWFFGGWLLPQGMWAHIYPSIFSTVVQTIKYNILTSLRLRRGLPAVKHALVTGSGSGMGASVVQQILDGHIVATQPGCHIYSYDIVEQPWKQENVTNIRANLRYETSDAMKLPNALPDGEPLDLVVCNASEYIEGMLVDITDDEIRKQIEINFISPIAMVAASIRHNKELGKPPPTFVLVSSLAQTFSYPGGAVFAGSKEGVVSYAKSLRKLFHAPVYVAFTDPSQTDKSAMVAEITLQNANKGTQTIWTATTGKKALATKCQNDHQAAENIMKKRVENLRENAAKSPV
eukprot:m.6304 g.6304  ORF g.6304 m.6304 type:complete len:598 (-) comp3516_c0_seq1:98-1891(-)